MPVANTRKYYEEETYYHVYSRGRSRQKIFRTDEDKSVFLNLLKRYLSKRQSTNVVGVPYSNFYGRIELSAFCLMDNHMHLLLYQNDNKAIPGFLQRILCSYTIYFNRKYGESGPLFESRYKAKTIDSVAYYVHISRYIDMNPDDWLTYEFSGLSYLRNGYSNDWFRPGRIQSQYNGVDDYIRFLSDYESKKIELLPTKYLADQI